MLSLPYEEIPMFLGLPVNLPLCLIGLSGVILTPEYAIDGQTLGDSEGQGGLVCCSPQGCKELDMT